MEREEEERRLSRAKSPSAVWIGSDDIEPQVQPATAAASITMPSLIEFI